MCVAASGRSAMRLGWVPAWLRRKRLAHNILHVFRITDMSFARALDGVAVIEFVTKRIEQATGVAPTAYSANYQKREWKTFTADA